MRSKRNKNLAEDLRENYNTRNPFELADKFGIKVLISKVLPADKKAYTIKSDNYPTIIIVNGRYEYKSQMVLCAHELGYMHFFIQMRSTISQLQVKMLLKMLNMKRIFCSIIAFDEEDFNIKCSI